jgi:hypothetical protein
LDILQFVSATICQTDYVIRRQVLSAMAQATKWLQLPSELR